jgi:hypothetical protein
MGEAPDMFGVPETLYWLSVLDACASPSYFPMQKRENTVSRMSSTPT